MPRQRVRSSTLVQRLFHSLWLLPPSKALMSPGMLRSPPTWLGTLQSRWHIHPKPRSRAGRRSLARCSAAGRRLTLPMPLTPELHPHTTYVVLLRCGVLACARVLSCQRMPGWGCAGQGARWSQCPCRRHWPCHSHCCCCGTRLRSRHSDAVVTRATTGQRNVG